MCILAAGAERDEDSMKDHALIIVESIEGRFESIEGKDSPCTLQKHGRDTLSAQQLLLYSIYYTAVHVGAFRFDLWCVRAFERARRWLLHPVHGGAHATQAAADLRLTNHRRCSPAPTRLLPPLAWPAAAAARRDFRWRA